MTYIKSIMLHRRVMALLLCYCLLLLSPVSVIAKAIMGVDLGSLYMKVALVQRNSPLEIVTNMHSKRKTENMILFDSGSRFYGADASSMAARKPLLTPESMSIFLGRNHDHPTVQVFNERHYPLTPFYNETRSGVCLTVDGQHFTPEELVAMVLSHAKDITNDFGVAAPIRDCVLTVPSFYTQHERRALLDAAELADLNVLALIDETTAAGLHFGLDRIDESPQNYLFYNMGGSALQVSIIQYHSYEVKESKYSKGRKVGSFQVLGKAWDATLGGQAFDALLVNYMADEFNEIWNKKRNDGQMKDVRDFPRAMAKIRVQANKAKHVLSANSDVPIFVDAVQDDVNYQSHMTRTRFEELCQDLLMRSIQPIHDALTAANLTMADIHGVELIGGGMRVPKVQEEIKKIIGNLELGLHINSDESMALGAAFHGANVSTAFKVRHVGMTDINPFPVSVYMQNMEEAKKSAGLFGMLGRSKQKVEASEEEEDWSKHVNIFKANGKLGVKKTIAFTHDHDIACTLDYDEHDNLPAGTPRTIERYNITGIETFAKEMDSKNLGKPKISLQFELTTSGLIQLIKAEAVAEETYMAKEEVEDKDAADEKSSADGTSETADPKDSTPVSNDTAANDLNTTTTTDKGEQTQTDTNNTNDASSTTSTSTAKAKVKKTKIIEVERKKVHRRTLTVQTYHVGRVKPYTPAFMAESKAKLDELARKDKERIMYEAAKNNFEAYIYRIKNKLEDYADEIASVTTDAQREALLKSAEAAEEWLYEEGYDASLQTYEEKYKILTEPAEKIFFRMNEKSARPAAIKTLRETLGKVEELIAKWEKTKPQVTAEERNEVLAQVQAVREWITTNEEAQLAADPSADPIFTSEQVPFQIKGVEALVAKLNKRPLPKPEAKKTFPDADSKNDTTSADGDNSTNSTTESESQGNNSGESTPNEETISEEEKAAEDEL